MGDNEKENIIFFTFNIYQFYADNIDIIKSQTSRDIILGNIYSDTKYRIKWNIISLNGQRIKQFREK